MKNTMMNNTTIASLDKAISVYTITSHIDTRFSHSISCEKYGLYVNFSANTDVTTSRLDNTDRITVIIGICVDAHGKIKRNDIADFINQQCGSEAEIYNTCKRFAGQYLIVYLHEDKRFILNDAAGFLHCCFACESDDICISNIEGLVAEYSNRGYSKIAQAIRRKSKGFKTLPGNLTIFEGIKVLLPNHYLDIIGMKSIRVPIEPLKGIDKYDAIDRTRDLVSTIAREYSKYNRLICPLTAGYDSRLVYSILYEIDSNVECYTIKHKSYTDTTDDITIPQQICKLYGSKHTILNLGEFKNEFNECIDLSSIVCCDTAAKMVDMGLTIEKAFPNRTIIDGQIVGQIGKSSYGGTIPNRLANPVTLSLVLHNRGRLAIKEMSKYRKEILETYQTPYIWDLFALESRCARWFSEYVLIYNCCGVRVLNLFNCSEVIELWISIPRRDRVSRVIHRQFLKMSNLELLDIPFNPDKKKTTFSSIIRNIWR